MDIHYPSVDTAQDHDWLGLGGEVKKPKLKKKEVPMPLMKKPRNKATKSTTK